MYSGYYSLSALCVINTIPPGLGLSFEPCGWFLLSYATLYFLCSNFSIFSLMKYAFGAPVSSSDKADTSALQGCDMDSRDTPEVLR